MTGDHERIPPDSRGPYRLIDEVIRHEKGTGITCRASVRGDEPYFAGHFPGHPIVPGVLEIEMLFLAARLFLTTEQAVREGGAIELTSIASAKFMKPIIPPRDLTVTVTLKEERGSEKLFSGRVSDDTDTFVQAQFSVTVL